MRGEDCVKLSNKNTLRANLLTSIIKTTKPSIKIIKMCGA